MLRNASIIFLVFLAFVGSGASRTSLNEVRPAPRSPIEQDSLALVAFAEENNRWLWTRGRNWLSGPLDTWFGVTVTDGRVTHLELPENNVIGNLPESLGDLSALKVLDLSSNFVSGSIPASINKLANLEILDLEENSLLSFPDSLGGMQQLRVFDVSGNYMQNALPEDVVMLSKLEVLDLSRGALFSLPDLSALRAFGVLQLLDVSRNFLRFVDIEPNLWVAREFLYDNQQDLHSTLTGIEGESVVLETSFGGQYNQYQWFRDGKALPGETTDRLILADFQQTESGTYVLEVTNRRATRLTLRHYFTVEFDSMRRLKWLDIGDYQHVYDFHGRNTPNVRGMVFPGFQRFASHGYTRSFWVGAKDWVDSFGEQKLYQVFRSGPGRLYGITPIEHKLVGRFEDTVVEVNGKAAVEASRTLDMVDAAIPADRMIYNVFTTALGITVDRRAYAFASEHHDDYHIITYTLCNTGNTDWDEEIELPDQTLNGVYFYWNHRWAGSEQAGWSVGSPSSVWGRLAMHDVVGDGNQEYPVDFTAQYGWNGFDPEYDAPFFEYDNLGAPLVGRAVNKVITIENLVAPGDTLGRLADPNMVGRVTLHADAGVDDRSYDRAQPSRIGWINSDWYTNYDGEGSIYLYTEHMRGEFFGARQYPHFADSVEPTGRFWDSDEDPGESQYSTALGGFSPEVAYGPYDMPFGSCINIAAADGVAGLSYDAAVDIGRAYVEAGGDRDATLIPYDANGDGEINDTPFDYDQVFVGTELQTKNQWVMSARDSLFNTFFRARDLYEATNMAEYPIVEPPRPPRSFSMWGEDEGIALSWQPATEGPGVTGWEVYRTEGWVDNLYVTDCLTDPQLVCGYEHVATLPATAVSFLDTEVVPDVDYFYYLQAIGEPQPVDARGIAGTPDGQPLKSGRYFTQTYEPVRLSSAPPDRSVPTETLVLDANYPNPFSNTTTIRYGLPAAAEVDLSVYDMLGRRVAVLVKRFQLGGQYEVQFQPAKLANGVYIYVLDTGNARIERTMLLIQ